MEPRPRVLLSHVIFSAALVKQCRCAKGHIYLGNSLIQTAIFCSYPRDYHIAQGKGILRLDFVNGLKREPILILFSIQMWWRIHLKPFLLNSSVDEEILVI